jgi:ribulose-phosphate 3-epimerase
VTLLAPSILAADFGHLAEEIAACEESGADRLHLDVMDNHFVPSLGMGPEVVAACRRSSRLFLEAHLMVDRPDGIIPAFAHAGADLITVHFEACPQLHRTVELVRREGASPGVGINPATPVDFLVDILPDISLALVMSVDPGFGGQTLLSSAFARVRGHRGGRRGGPGECGRLYRGRGDCARGRYGGVPSPGRCPGGSGLPPGADGPRPGREVG